MRVSEDSSRVHPWRLSTPDFNYEQCPDIPPFRGWLSRLWEQAQVFMDDLHPTFHNHQYTRSPAPHV